MATYRNIVAAALALAGYAWGAATSHTPHAEDTVYDYIVVGGGTAGLTVATRLAQRSFRVAVIEAGSRYEDISQAELPAAAGCPGSNYRRLHFPRGKCLGGSSAVNYMIYQRPTEQSMLQWAEAVDDRNNPGPVQVSYPNYAMAFSTWMKLGMNAIGIPDTKDFNSGSLMGTQYCSSTIQPINETRSSSDAFLSDIDGL
ncbi:uncharacterized protein ACLA_003670 [Aspergillus clavatus NRRL 1]|uniref:glucose oxidase n=1 Tax=Aspergillus clavatus (strain ATCC 1007 / CBS 513.65 / DSM 816 / NCTC 3887 / NRRL 1 / QM 1276 / 107) TaxID=344612 RepID=A1C5I6_ASPCL|nr:uncharacterized protein ACLA_003670 [Aspergillus clavatus NRRL 1]EAW14954.1 hypothetical protein ACLA_003670 [Aspergillus clavatus NRRL 1]